MIDSGIDSVHRNNSARDGPANNLSGDCLYVASITDTCRQTVFVHGSHVAGIASARDNGKGWIGIAWGLYRFASVRIFDADTFSMAALATALDWTVSNGYTRQIVNMSLGACANNSTVATAIASSLQANNLLVASAGNVLSGDDCGGSIGTTGVKYPARYSGVVGVSGTTPADGFALAANNPCSALSGFGSRFGSQVDVAAPFWDTSMVANGAWGLRCGTSMAAPKVAAAAALVWGRYQSMSAWDVWMHLCNTAVTGLGDGDHFGCGRVSISNAFEPADELLAYINGPSQIPYYQTCGWEAGTSGGLGPYSYQWSGVLSGSGASIGGADLNGLLYLTVYSGDGQEAEANLYISTSEEGSC